MQPDKANRIFDYAIKYDDQIYLLEISYYGGGGSKLKATAGEYKTLYDFLSKQGFKFIWITDGLGWKTTTRALQETFNHVDHVINLKMLADGILEGIVLNKL